MASFEEELDEYITAKATVESLAPPDSPQFADEQRSNNALHKPNQLPEGFEVSADPQYAQNQNTGIWLDLSTGDMSYYDQDTQTYIPIQHEEGRPESLEFQGMARLVVVESGSWPIGNVVDVSNDEGGLSIGRDRLQDFTMHQFRIPEIEVSRYHARIYVSSNDISKGLIPSLACKSPYTSAGSEDGEIEAGSAGDLSEGECFIPGEDHGSSLQICAQPSMYIIDQGSTHGTFVNGVRLSDPKVTSKPRRLSHLDQIELGSTKLEFHVHEQWACEKCHNSGHNEIPTLIRKDDGDEHDHVQNKPFGESTSSTMAPAQHNDINQERIENMNAIKRRYQSSQKGAVKKGTGTPYTDRAKLRRQLQVTSHHPSGAGTIDTRHRKALTTESDHRVKRQQSGSTSSIPIEQENKGYSLLTRIGWIPGSGLGADESGIVNPVEVTGNDSRAGLGAAADQEQESKRSKAARIARDRFNGI